VLKTVVLVGDGMGDRPCPALKGQTPLQAAHIPNMRRLAATGACLLAETVPPGLPPGSDVANLGLLGYDAREYYSGRAPIEAAGGGIDLQPDETAFRCNLVHIANDHMVDHSAGHISTAEGDRLIRDLQAELGSDVLQFHTGVQYRHLLVWKGAPDPGEASPPHEILEQPIASHLPNGPGAQEVLDLMARSRDILAGHPVNQARIAKGQLPATQIWLWGQGHALQLPPYPERFGLTGTVVSAVDLVRGLGLLAGLDAPVVEGATGWMDTNYAGKVDAALQALQTQDFAYVHVEAPDECGHLGDAALKTQAIADFDREVVGPMWQALEKAGEPYRLLVTMDHRTPVETRGHSAEPVPLVTLRGPLTVPATEEAPFDEFVNGGIPQIRTFEWIPGWLRGDV
jgi:2,3-bisphosphoglycerate-independent phosphoglycerate mutase